MVANYFRLNYSVGRTHSGMIAYLAELWNNGDKTPLLTFLESLDIMPPESSVILRPKLEHNNIDLAIFQVAEDKKDHLFLLVEMKVDDRQGWKKFSKQEIRSALPFAERLRPYFSHLPYRNNPYLIQTEMYTFRESLHELSDKERPTCLFVTLGNGEFYDSFTSPHDIWTGVNLATFAGAIDKISSPDLLIQQWVDALNKEKELRQTCWAAPSLDMSELISGDRHQLLAMMRLGSLRTQLLGNSAFTTLGSKPRVYKANTDTILNFASPDTHSHPTGFRFCEINSNGCLNFKIYFHESSLGKDLAKKEMRQRYCDEYSNGLARTNIPQEDWIFPGSNRDGKSRTIRSLRLGLNKRTLTLEQGISLEEIINKIITALNATQSIIHYDKQ